MTLSPADFAAYSRATGTPYPESPEKRAEMVPEVRAFRQNQLQRSNNQGSETLALGIGLGLGLAGLGTGALKLRGRGKAQPKKDTAGKSSVKMADLSDQPVPKSKTQVYADVAAKAEEDLPPVTRPKGGEEIPTLLTDPVTGEMYRPGGGASKRAQEVLNDRVNQLLSEVSVGEAEPEKAARILRNRQKDKARVSDYMSDVLESVISETEFASETIPSDILKLAERAGTGNIDAQDVNTFKNWAEGTFKNDPVVLGEINETLSSTTFSPKTSTLTETYEAFGEPVAQVQNIEALDTAFDQRDARLEAVVQRDTDSVKYGKAAVVQEIAQEPVRMVRRQGKLVPLNQLQEQAAQLAPPQVGLRQQDPNRFLRKAPSVSAEEINTFAGRFDVYGRPIPKAEQTLGLIGPQPRNVYSAETPGPAPANEAQIARRELARRAETLLEDIQTEEQAKGILFELAAQYDPQQALAAKRAELQAKGLKGQRLEKSLAATTGPDVRAVLEDARLQPGLQTEGAPLKFSREVPNVGPEAVVTKTAIGSAIRGAGRLSDEPPAQIRERTLFGDYPDPLVTGQPVDLVPDRPGKETVMGQMISAPTPRIDKYAESQEGAGGGIGVYGRGTNYVPGAMSKQTGEYSAAAQRKPTETTGFKTLSDLPTPYQGLSDQDLGQLTMLGSKTDAYNAERELAKRRSFDVSRDIRRIQTSGRPDAQQLVKDYIKNLGLES